MRCFGIPVHVHRYLGWLERIAIIFYYHDHGPTHHQHCFRHHSSRYRHFDFHFSDLNKERVFFPKRPQRIPLGLFFAREACDDDFYPSGQTHENSFCLMARWKGPRHLVLIDQSNQRNQWGEGLISWWRGGRFCYCWGLDWMVVMMVLFFCRYCLASALICSVVMLW